MRSTVVISFVAASLAGCGDGHVVAQAQSLNVTDAWMRETGEGSNGAAYLTLSNNDSTAIGIDSISTIAARVAELHETTLTDGIARMVPQSLVTIQPDSTLPMEPGGLHVMLVEVVRPLVRGDSITLHLHLSNGQTYSSYVKVQAR